MSHTRPPDASTYARGGCVRGSYARGGCVRSSYARGGCVRSTYARGGSRAQGLRERRERERERGGFSPPFARGGCVRTRPPDMCAATHASYIRCVHERLFLHVCSDPRIIPGHTLLMS
jgi:hypothetical protein